MRTGKIYFIGFFKNLLLLGISVFLSAELAVRFTGVDFLMLKPLLYYQTSDIEVQQMSPNPNRLYQLKPGAKTLTTEFQKPVSINSLGFRGPEKSAKKPSGVTRIVCLGGSTTYGAAVSDTETFPYYLEETLNRGYKGKFEVLNAGLCANVLGSETAYAREILEKYDPDIFIFQHGNQGRRAFPPDTPYAHFFYSNPQLFLENLRFLPFPKSAVGLWVLRHSAAYRAAVILANCFMFIPQNNPAYDGEQYNLDVFAAFYREVAPGKPVLLFPLKMLCDFPGQDLTKMVQETRVPVIKIFDKQPNLPSEYFMVHPPAHVYKWYAQGIAEELRKNGLVSKK
ncbi:MAG TPA: hypothetical protein PLL10_03435 [Elusimicrobiales bacterium]|nr:hypothetical protein [Elusimicrobiales bacterium]